MRLTLDHHYPTAIAVGLRERGHDVDTAAERGWQVVDDDVLLALCAGESRVLMTNNVADFAPLVREWAAQGRAHLGLVFTSDSSLPRTTAMVGRYVGLLDDLMRAHPGDAALTDRIVWLVPT